MQRGQQLLAFTAGLLAEGVTLHQIDAAIDRASEIRLGESISLASGLDSPEDMIAAHLTAVLRRINAL